MSVRVTEPVDFRSKAERALERIREGCHRWPVGDEIKSLRDYLGRAGLSLADIGTSEEEMQACFKEGQRSSAKNWLKVARESDNLRDVETALGHVRDRLAEAGLTLDDIGTSEAELSFLLSSHQPAPSWWRRLFKRQPRP